ncbi:hypothetical protein [Streptomyces sp. NPDC057257]|uniref:hypothetical protein n=1 Tax=Streptomyces sp. NPDC057257 TaxID=3346071 RepID=UPI00362CC5E6
MVVLAGVAALALLGGAFLGQWHHGSTKPAPSLNLHTVDWRNAQIPGTLCRSSGPISLHDGFASNVPSTFDGPEPNMAQDVSADVKKVAYGDLTGDGKDEAALPVLCMNHDSTAAGQTAMGILIFDGSSNRLHLLGTLVGQQRRSGEPPNFLEVRQMAYATVGKVVAVESFYAPTDYNSCPTGRARDTWVYKNGQLKVAGSEDARYVSADVVCG